MYSNNNKKNLNFKRMKTREKYSQSVLNNFFYALSRNAEPISNGGCEIF